MDMLKVAAMLEDLSNELVEKESIIKKASLVENITDILIDRNEIVTLNQFREKVAELKEMTTEELSNLSTILQFTGEDSYGFGKLLSKKSSMDDNMSAEEKFNSIILGG